MSLPHKAYVKHYVKMKYIE